MVVRWDGTVRPPPPEDAPTTLTTPATTITIDPNPHTNHSGKVLLSDVVGAAIHLSELAAREIMDVKLAGAFVVSCGGWMMPPCAALIG